MPQLKNTPIYMTRFSTNLIIPETQTTEFLPPTATKSDAQTLH